MTPVLETRHLGMVFPGTGGAALSDVSIALHPGQALALVGESGSGKSTCARLLTRMMTATEGSILYEGQDVTRLGNRKQMLEYRRHVQMVFQDPFAALNPTHSVRHHLQRPLALHKPELNKAARLRRVEEILQLVGLDPDRSLEKFPHELSGGQRQRINLARAIAVDPSVLIADEPTSMLDVSIRLSVLDSFSALKKSRGIAMLYITHDIATARYVAEQVAVIYAGRIVESGPTDQVIDQPRHAYTKLLLEAVPEVGKSFGEGLAKEADRVRRASRGPGELSEVAPGHFVRTTS